MLEDAVRTLRRFNRSFTPRIGVLDESFLGTGRPLAAARLLFEIGADSDADVGVGVDELKRRLGVDAGYLSRLLHGLVDDGLVMLSDDVADGRRRFAALAEAGRSEWQLLDGRSAAIAQELLAPLDGARQAELVDALDTADRLLRLATLQVDDVEPNTVGARAAMASYFAELSERFDDGFEVDDRFDDELVAMRSPTGGFIVARDGAAVVGCGGLRRFDDTTAEIKRMWLHSSLRGLGVGKQLLARLEALAVELGYDVVVLDTNAVLTQAIAMYEGAGYESIERYNDNPYAQRWFRKSL